MIRSDEEWAVNMSKIYDELNYRKLLKSPLKDIESYDLETHHCALGRAIDYLRLRRFTRPFDLDECILGSLMIHQEKATVMLINRRTMLRCEKALRRGTRLNERVWRARKAWQELSPKVRRKLLRKRYKERCCRASIIETHRKRAYRRRSRVH